jgi:hypothetical protein
MPRNDLKNGHLICFPFKLNVKQRKDGSSVTKNSALYRNTYMLNLKVEFNYSTFSIEDFNFQLFNYSTFSIEDFNYSILSVEVFNFQQLKCFSEIRGERLSEGASKARSDGRGLREGASTEKGVNGT